MSFRLFLRGFLITLAVFAGVNYVLTQSVAATVINTVICAVLIQIGYFLAVLVLVARSRRHEEKPRGEPAEAPLPAGRDGKATGKSGRLGGLPRSGHS